MVEKIMHPMNLPPEPLTEIELDSHYRCPKVSVKRTHIDSYRLLTAHAVGVSCGSLWMDKLASPGRTAAR
jgi:hypothetical protein